MKKIIIILSLLGSICYSYAQDDYKHVMLQNIVALDTATDAKGLTMLAATFAAMYNAKKDWHPLYYECLSYIKLSGVYTNIEQKKSAIDKAEELLNDLPAENDEVQVLQAFYAMNYLGIDRREWQKFMPMMNDALKKAENLNTGNPRIYYLRGILTYNMPESMGGGHEEGIKLFQESLKKFESYKPTDELAPAWGRREVEKYLGKN